MEDVQDGIKVSIQDGVEEDPTIVDPFDIGGKSYLALIAIKKELTCPTVTTGLGTSTTSEDFTGTIATVLATGVA